MRINAEKEELQILSVEIERLRTAMKFYDLTVGEGINGGSSSYHNVVQAGGLLRTATSDLINRLNNLGLK